VLLLSNLNLTLVEVASNLVEADSSLEVEDNKAVAKGNLKNQKTLKMTITRSWESSKMLMKTRLKKHSKSWQLNIIRTKTGTTRTKPKKSSKR
jgi:hypothetical protein